MRWWERIIRRFLIMGLVTVAIIFWSIPSAFIGIISNIKFLSSLPFLTWIKLLPGAVTGFLQGFLPAIALSFWMSLVPAMLRCMFYVPRDNSPSNLCSLWYQGWYSVHGVGRTVYTRGLLCIPDRAGLFDHDSYLGGLGNRHDHHQGAVEDA
jgi:hypothetical protein